MQVILLEKVVNLGNLGDIVKVKDGYARNFLIPTRAGPPRHRSGDQANSKPSAPNSKRPPPTSWPTAQALGEKLAGTHRPASRRRPASTAACSARSPTPTSPKR